MNILLVTATAMEMRAVLSGLPSAGAVYAAQACPAEKGGSSSGTECSLETAGAHLPRKAKAPELPDKAAFPLSLSVGQHCLYPLVCGIGPVNAAFALGRRLGQAEGPEKKAFFAAVLNMGIAGTYDPDRLPVGSVALASAEIWPEYGLADAGHVDSRGIGFAQAVYRGGRIVERVELAPQEVLGSLGFRWHTLPLEHPAVTVAGCSASPSQAGRIQERTQGLMENMEGFALALGCLQYENDLGMPGVDGSSGIGPSGAEKTVFSAAAKRPGCLKELPALPFVEIRSISNRAGYRPPEGWDVPGALSALACAAKELFA